MPDTSQIELPIGPPTEQHSEPLPEQPKKKRRLWVWLLGGFAATLLVGAVVAVVGLYFILSHYGRGLPDVNELANYEPQVITRIHAGDGSLLTEFARQRRLFVPISAVPELQIKAFLAAEDKNFYSHQGLDYLGILRAAFQNVKNVITGRRLVGASTITQQMARNFLLTLDQRVDRKIKEAILSFRIERAFTKDQILELYLNEIYFGYGAHGIAAAALNYFNKSLDELTLSDMAYLAALPKAPNNYHPQRRTEAAIGRRNWVLGRMRKLGFITFEEAFAAAQEDLITSSRTSTRFFQADYFEEEVRRELYNIYGENQLYGGGLSVRTTLEPRLQGLAESTLRNGLIEYDRRHGWRGPLTRISIGDGWWERLGEIHTPLGVDSWRHAVVLELREDGAVIGFEGGSFGFIPFAEMTWARAWRFGEKLGPSVRDVSDVLNIGDVVPVELMEADALANLPGFFTQEGEPVGPVMSYGLRQVPAVEGAIVVMDPHTGRVLAMVGGWDYAKSEYNRATQAERQPGSAFKPFVYAAALEEGFTPSSLVLDAPFVIDQGFGRGKWKPSNSSNRFYGPSTLRLGMEKSRNLMTVRLAQYIGMEKVVAFAERFGLERNLEPTLANALGAGEVTLLELTTAYSMLVNSGKRITPTFIDRIQDRRGATVFAHDVRACPGCNVREWQGQAEPVIPDEREQVLDPRTAYQMVSMLEGVVRNGTGRKIRVLGQPMAGKTGTTNDWFDAWFVGFSADLTVGVFVGFDRPHSMGTNEEGSAVAVPIFRDFMAEASSGQAGVPFRIPPGIRLVRVNADTGMPARSGDTNIILEAFIPGTEPNEDRLVLDGPDSFMRRDGKVRKGTGGLY